MSDGIVHQYHAESLAGGNGIIDLGDLVGPDQIGYQEVTIKTS